MKIEITREVLEEEIFRLKSENEKLNLILNVLLSILSLILALYSKTLALIFALAWFIVALVVDFRRYLREDLAYQLSKNKVGPLETETKPENETIQFSSPRRMVQTKNGSKSSIEELMMSTTMELITSICSEE